MCVSIGMCVYVCVCVFDICRINDYKCCTYLAHMPAKILIKQPSNVNDTTYKYENFKVLPTLSCVCVSVSELI